MATSLERSQNVTRD